MFFHSCVRYHVFSKYYYRWKSYHTDYMNIFSFLCVFSNDFLAYYFGKNSYYIYYKNDGFLLFEDWGVYLMLSERHSILYSVLIWSHVVSRVSDQILRPYKNNLMDYFQWLSKFTDPRPTLLYDIAKLLCYLYTLNSLYCLWWVSFHFHIIWSTFNI